MTKLKRKMNLRKQRLYVYDVTPPCVSNLELCIERWLPRKRRKRERKENGKKKRWRAIRGEDQILIFLHVIDSDLS